MSTIKTTNITHGSNTGTNNLILDSNGNTAGPNSPAWFGKQATVSETDIADQTYTQITGFSVNRTNPASGWDYAAGTFTVPTGKGGTYVITAGVGVDDTDNDEKLILKIYKNGSGITPWTQEYGSVSDDILCANLHLIHPASAGDIFSVWAWHNAGETIPTENSRTYFGGFRLAI